MHNRRINVRAIIWRDGKVLAVKHKKHDGSESMYWATPGGGLDPYETLEDGLKREIMEELGVKAEIGRLLFNQQLYSGRRGFDEELEFFYEVTNVDDFLDFDFTKTSHGAIEIARAEFIDPRGSSLLPHFLAEADLESYVRSVHPVVNYNNFPETIHHHKK